MSEEWYNSIAISVRLLWPEIEKYEDTIQYIYASTNYDYAVQLRPVEDIVSEIKEAFTNGKSRVIFFNNPETVIDTLVHRVQQVVNLLPEVDPSYFIFTTSSPYGQDAYNKMCDKFNWSRRIHVLAGDHFELVVQDFMRPILPYNKEYQVRLKQKKFVCFNKVHRMHRAQLIADMFDADLVKDAFYSFQGGYPGWLNEYKQLESITDSLKFVDTLVAHENEFPLTLNITDNRHNPIDLIPDDIVYHDESYFSVITETIFYGDKYAGLTLSTHEDTLFISEKTYKAIAFKHPFIVLGCPGTLEHLRETGYRTFHPFIDESYDATYNDVERYNMVVREIKRLCSLTDSEWLEWQSNIKDIIEHNYKVLTEKKVFHCVENIDKLFE